MLLMLVEAADWKYDVVAGILGVTPSAVGIRMAAKCRAAWRDRRATFRRNARRDNWRRQWWRKRMEGIGIDPATLTPDDPAWHACWARPRGWAVTEVAKAMRAEGADLRQLDAQVALLRRVEALQAAHLAPLRAVRGAPEPPEPSDL